MTTIDQHIAEKLNNWYIGEWPIGNFFLCVIALTLAVVLCGAIGMERELRGRSAGLRTHLLVGVGSCMIMIISIYGFPAMFQGDRDVSRLAAQIIAGVGFLGAGAIIYRNSGTKGLTTAATIWIVMAIGLACGSMNFILAVGGTLLILVVLTVFRKVERHINHHAPLLSISAKPDSPVIGRLLEVAKKCDCTIHDLHVELNENSEIEATFLAVANANELQAVQLISELEHIDGVTRVAVINSHQK